MKKTSSEPSRFEIWKMFDAIAQTYDRANRIMTFWLDLYWRKKVCSYFPQGSSIDLLDLATGTGDQIIAAKKTKQKLGLVVGIDLSSSMLLIARKKVEADFICASALDIPYPKETFDVVTMSFGIRNVTDSDLCLREMFRVLKAGGRAVILEGTVPENSLLRQCHLFYLRGILPRIGAVVSKNKDAYVYLNQTIQTFPSGKAFCEKIRQAGFSKTTAIPLTGGTVTIYIGEK